MPRLAPCLFRQASRHSPNLAALIPACRDLESARNELRWIKEHAEKTATRDRRRERLRELCQQRGRGVPLQYILGSQPFGHLDIRCRPGVLIPRPETEAYTCHLVDLIKSERLRTDRPDSSGQSLNIIDFCTGTGCIPLLLFSKLQRSFDALKVLGVDVSSEAIGLARENIDRQRKQGHICLEDDRQRQLRMLQADIFSDPDMEGLAESRWDIIVSNPPYISQRVWNCGDGQMGYSVRKYEPHLALVPDNHLPKPVEWEQQDVFYSRLLDLATIFCPKLLLMELGDEDQARRILSRFSQHPFASGSSVDVWRDHPDLDPGVDENTWLTVPTTKGQSWEVPVRGTGSIRCIHIRNNTGCGIAAR